MFPMKPMSLMKRIISVMKHECETRLHKITSYTSYKAVVMGTFDVNDHGEQLKDRDCDDTDHNPLFFKEFVYVYVADCKKYPHYSSCSGFGCKPSI